MGENKYRTIRGVAKMVWRVGLAAMPLCVIAYVALQSLLSASADTPETNVSVSLEPSLEERTRVILHEDLNEAWGSYEGGEFSDEMWEGVRSHVTRNWNAQAQPKGWDVLGWEVPKTEGPDAPATSALQDH